MELYILGIVTNAIWDVLKPATKFLFEFTLNLSILGIESFKNDIYKEIAKGLHEGISLQIFLLIYTFLIAIITTMAVSIFFLNRKIAMHENPETKLTFVDKFNFFQKDLPRRYWFKWFILFYFLFTFTILTLDLTKQKYINNAITHFEQLLKIGKPYMSEEQYDLYLSNFSQMNTRNEYVKILQELEEMAKINSQIIPEFSFTF